ncbi:MAG: hypothetical protein, partial [Olavius algarvensis Gamma 1 endosymbiont]
AKLRLIADCAGYAITQESLTIPLLDHFRNYHYLPSTRLAVEFLTPLDLRDNLPNFYPHLRR